MRMLRRQSLEYIHSNRAKLFSLLVSVLWGSRPLKKYLHLQDAWGATTSSLLFATYMIEPPAYCRCISGVLYIP